MLTRRAVDVTFEQEFSRRVSMGIARRIRMLTRPENHAKKSYRLTAV
jgi:hypothetical protein